MTQKPKTGAAFIAGGSVAGAGISATVGGMGLAGGFGGVGIGAVPMVGVGAVAGAAAYGAFKAIGEGDAAAFGAMGIGAVGGAGISNVVGGMGLIAPKIGLAFGIGTAPMAAVGAVVGLAAYGIAKLLDESGTEETPVQVFDRMEEKVLQMDAYSTAVMELEAFLSGEDLNQKFAALEFEDELQALKDEFKKKTQPNSSQFLTAEPSTTHSKTEALSLTTQIPETSHNGFVYSVAFSPDGKIVASGSADKTIRLWGGYTGELKRTLNGHSDAVLSVAISPDSKTLASGSADQTIKLWDLKTWEQRRILTGHLRSVNTVVISPDGKNLISGSTDSTIKLWNLHSGELLCTLSGHSAAILSVAISPDGQTLASSSTDDIIQLWNLHTQELLQTLSGRSPIAFSPDSKTFLCGAKGSTIKIWRHMQGFNESTFDPILSGEWWEVLGVDQGDHPHVIKGIYRRLARQYHPDVNNSASAKASMQAINQAYKEFQQKLKIDQKTKNP